MIQNVFGVVFALAFCVIFYWFMSKKKESEVTVHAAVSYTHLDVYKRQYIHSEPSHLDMSYSIYIFVQAQPYWQSLSFEQQSCHSCLLYTSRCV